MNSKGGGKSIIQHKRHIFAILVVTTVVVMLNHHHGHGKGRKKEIRIVIIKCKGANKDLVKAVG